MTLSLEIETAVHRALKAAAKASGMALPQWVRATLTSAAGDDQMGKCLFCGDPLHGAKLTCCGSERCRKEQFRNLAMLHNTRIRIQEMRKCRFCKEASLKGLPFCETHQYEREPCQECGHVCTRTCPAGCMKGKVRRLVGAGRPSVRCDDCWSRRKKKRRSSFSDDATGFA